jgi:hypothetical protein
VCCCNLLDIQIEITKQKIIAAMSAATGLELLYERALVEFRKENERKEKHSFRRSGRTTYGYKSS